jgi:hypothetical protein
MGQESSGSPLNVLVLYDPRAVFTNTVREHLASFARYSRHRIAYAPATATHPLRFPLDGFDVVVIHYTVRLACAAHLSPEFAWALKRYRGLKAAFLQDEYEHTWRASQWLDQLGVRLVFTCVPAAHVPAVYSRVDQARVAFVPTLTGYLPTDSDLDRHVKPLADRRVVIGYRGRELPFWYGRLGREKLVIGMRMRAECAARGIAHDIEWAEDKRIYGPAWVEFVASCRATLGTESGSNVFDFDGTLAERVAAARKANPRLTYEEVEDRYLRGREMDGVMNQVSPRIFEAVALRTGLLLFEGTYSGVVRPDEHFIPLRKDFRNVEEVLRRVRDDRELAAMTERAYRDVIGSGAYTYASFVRGVDAALDRHAGPGRSPALPEAMPGWTRDVPPAPAEVGGWRAVLRRNRFVHKILRGPWRAGRRLAKALATPADWVRQWRGAAALVRATPDLGELVRTKAGRREALRLSLLRHACRDCPTVLAPLWTTVEFEPRAGRLRFVSRPVHDLPGEIGPGRPVLDRALAAVRGRGVRQVVWEFPDVPPELVLKLDGVGVVAFRLGRDRVFRFTALERLADQDPERAARLLAAVADGASAPPSAAAGPGGELLRRAS